MVYYIIILTHLTFMSDGDRINTDNWQMTDKIFSLQYQYIIKQISNKNINKGLLVDPIMNSTI